MKRYYVIHRALWDAKHILGPETQPLWALFRQAHFLDLTPGDDGLILVSAEHRSDGHASLFHSIHTVAHLPHPVHERTVPLPDLHRDERFSHKRYRPHHHEALASRLDLADHHTVWDLHHRMKAIHPLCVLDESDLY